MFAIFYNLDLRRLLAALVAVAVALFGAPNTSQAETEVPSVFDMPRIQTQHTRLRVLGEALAKQGRYDEASKAFAGMIKLVPHDPLAHYRLAGMLARQGRETEALPLLTKATELGFNRPQVMKNDVDLESLHDKPAFNLALDAAALAHKPDNPWQRQVQPASVSRGQVTVGANNTGWDGKHGILIAAINPPPEELRAQPVFKGQGEVGDLLRKWNAEGSAAGNYGDFYDNHDNDHSNLSFQQFPQLTRIEFDRDVKKRQIHSGLQSHFLYTGVVIGNSSTAMVNTPYWRSQPRLGYVNRRSVALMYVQYRKNHLYFYPEHKDHDHGHNGRGGGHGDVYPINTPYVIISQGSSGSDRPFMDAVASTLAAFRPEVKQRLVKAGMLMPAVQFAFRASNRGISYPRDYLTGAAHPSVFEKNDIDLKKMVQVAHGMTTEKLPPLAQLKVVEEDEPTPGIDYFDFGPRQKLCDTPCAIGRVHRTKAYHYRMVVSAEESVDINGAPLTFHWKVLRGNEFATKINPLNDDGSVVELIVPYHRRRPIAPGEKMASSRVDIACFVHNGTLYSPPSFVSIATLDNQVRSYDDDHKIQSIKYTDSFSGGNYADPLLHTTKTWTDNYHYDDQGQLTGWTRQHDGGEATYTANGELVEQADALGRATVARAVRYVPQRRGNKPPILQAKPTNELRHYEYESPTDMIGRVVRRAIDGPDAQGNEGEDNNIETIIDVLP